MGWQTRKKPPRNRPEQLPANLEREIYTYICANVPFVRVHEVAEHFVAKYNYTSQHIRLVLRKLFDKGYVKRSLSGDITLHRRAPIQWAELDKAEQVEGGIDDSAC